MNQKDTPVSPLYYKILVTLMLALSIILGVWAAYSHLSARAYRTALQNTFCRAADSAADNLANLSDDLVKGMYTGSRPQLSQICARLWKESAAAKSLIVGYFLKRSAVTMFTLASVHWALKITAMSSCHGVS